jgi:hypothetical protein
VKVRREIRLVDPLVAVREATGRGNSLPELWWRMSVEPIRQKGVVPNEYVGLEILVRRGLRHRGRESGRSV